MYANKVTDEESRMAIIKDLRSGVGCLEVMDANRDYQIRAEEDMKDLANVTHSMILLYSPERRLRKGAKCLKVVGANRADQIRAKKAVKDMKNLANVTHSVKQLSLAERTVARDIGDTTSEVKGKSNAHQIPAKSTGKGGKYSRTNESSKARKVLEESERKIWRVCIDMPFVKKKSEKIKLQMAFLSKVVSCPAEEAYSECFSSHGTFLAKLTDEEVLKLKGMEEVFHIDRGLHFVTTRPIKKPVVQLNF